MLRPEGLLPDQRGALVERLGGGPYFNDYRDCGHADLWLAEGDDMLRRDQPSQ
ncbi:MAG TPA: hypothetical protein QF556_00830 [Rhodospirillales bacterium]|nr:hypothetical protein [Rhodospirillaceae bacterium]HIJ93086.1 hypothetical protein [Rhodospirillaceae bacterium]HJP53250.1 hypothetical protein [Rhodospirillales bacterium]